MTDADIIESNRQFQEAWYAQASSSGQVFDRDGLSIANANQPWSFMNMVMLKGPVADEKDLKHRARVALNYFEARNNWFLTASEDWFGSNAGQLLADLGFVFKFKLNLVGMVAERLALPRRPLPDVEVHRIDNEATRCALSDLNADSYVCPETGEGKQSQGPLYGAHCSLELSPM